MKKVKDDQSTKKLSGINIVGEVVNANPKLTSFSREFQLMNLFLVIIKNSLGWWPLKKKKEISFNSLFQSHHFSLNISPVGV